MIFTRYIRRFCALLAGVAGLFATNSRAALPVADGDLFLCFRATGGLGASTDYVLNLGSAAQFVGTTGVVPINLGNMVADLETIYGADWKTRADLAWSISGVQKFAGNGFPLNTMFASHAEPAAGTQSEAWLRPNPFGAGAPALKLQAMRDVGFAAGTKEDGSQIESTNNPTTALIQSINAANSYASYLPGGANTTGATAFAYFGGTGTIESTFENGTASSVLDLYKVEPGTGPGVLLGAFRLSDAGQMTFSADILVFQGPALVKFSNATYSAPEDTAGGMVTLTVERSGNVNSAFSLNVSTADGTAVAGTDYVALSNAPLNFAAGETSKTVDVTIVNRAGFQGDRAFTVTLAIASGSPQLANPFSAIVSIGETTPQPPIIAFSAGSYSIAEDAVAGHVTVTINRSGNTTSAAGVSFSTQDGTAVAGVDFTGQTDTAVSFVSGETTKSVDVVITNRDGFQGNRSFNVVLSAPTNGAALGSPSTATVTIQESAPNPAGSVAFSASAYSFSVVLGQSNNATIVLNRTAGTTGAITVDVALASGGTLTPGQNFTFTSPTTVNFADGQATASLNIPLIASATAPSPGTFNLQLLNATAGASVGTPATATVTVTQAAPVSPTGVYTGLITPAGSTPPGGNLNNASGLLSVNVTKTGAFSGKVLIAGGNLPIKGAVGNDGVLSFKPANGPTLLLATKGKTAVTLGELSLGLVGGKLVGAIGTVATIEAPKAAFDGKTPATTPDVYFLANKGKHTAVLPSKAQTDLGTTEFPQGDGVGNITITKQGKLSFKGKLADGTPLSMSGPLSADLQVALFAQLYAKKGSIGGVVTLDKTAADTDVEGTDFLWLRPAITNSKVYPAGWPGGVAVDLVGARYAVPSNESVLLGLGAEDLVAGNAKLETDALAAPNPRLVSISTKNKVTNVPATDRTFKVTIAAPTGAISGFFPHTDGSKTKFAGIILQKGDNKGGFGYYLSNVPRNSPPGVSGGISLSKK